MSTLDIAVGSKDIVENIPSPQYRDIIIIPSEAPVPEDDDGHSTTADKECYLEPSIKQQPNIELEELNQDVPLHHNKDVLPVESLNDYKVERDNKDDDGGSSDISTYNHSHSNFTNMSINSSGRNE